MIDSTDLKKIKHDLASRKQILTKKMISDKKRASEEEYSTELSNYDNHPGDNGTELYEREKDLAISSHDKSELESINEALERIETDQYGTCDVCGTEIDIERLKARPETTVCYEHAQSDSQREEEKDHSMSSLEIDETDSWNTLADYGSSQSHIDRSPSNEDYKESTTQSGDETADKMDQFSNEESLD